MTMTTPDLAFRISNFGQEWLSQFADGWTAAITWLASGPATDEVVRVARIHVDLRDGGITGCDIITYNADHFPSFLAFLDDTPHARKIRDGVAEMSDINERQGTNFPAWPKRCFSISFDEDVLLGFAAACHTAARLDAR